MERRGSWALPAPWGRALTTKLLSLEVWLLHVLASAFSKYVLACVVGQPLARGGGIQHGTAGICGLQSLGRAGIVHSSDNRNSNPPRMEC